MPKATARVGTLTACTQRRRRSHSKPSAAPSSDSGSSAYMSTKGGAPIDSRQHTYSTMGTGNTSDRYAILRVRLNRLLTRPP
jgi:hypothetical protein